MSAVEKMLGRFEHQEGESRVEDILSANPVFNEKTGMLALRFISAKGLSGEFADVLEQIESTDPDLHAFRADAAEGPAP
ncbi:MAG: hypothetical protein DI635_16240 [Pseudoxanthomonas suwonensis]|nr:MAG: hypothetical protein DI635_16240 [Pseudoxanthomonas suwonensis]